MSLFKHLREDAKKQPENELKRLKFFELCLLFEEILSISSSLEKESRLSSFILDCYQVKKYPVDDLKIIYQLISKDFTHLETDEETGVSVGIFIQALSEILNKTKDEIKFFNRGDWGETTSKLWDSLKKKGSKLNAVKILENLFLLPKLIGKGSQSKKISNIKQILLKSSSIESKYFARLIIGGSMKIGVQEKLIQKAFYTSFSALREFESNIDYSNKVRQLNFGFAVKWFLENTLNDRLKDLKMKPGHPIKLMLADRGTIDLIESEIHFVEEKYDGYRIQTHVNKKTVWLYSRQLSNQTNMLPDVIKHLKSACKASSAIFDGEIIAYDLKSGNVLPFQSIIRRKRKYETKEVASRMKTEYRIFDLLYVDGNDITTKTLIERRNILESIIEENEFIKLSEVLKTDKPDEALNYAQKVKQKGHEGVIIKHSSSIYHIGIRDKSWIKIKPEIYDLDGIVIGGQYGTGKRKDMISRLFIAFPNEKIVNKYDCLGVAVGSGISEEEMNNFKHIFEDNGSEVKPDNLNSSSLITPDLWLDPSVFNIVIEVLADSFSWKTDNKEPKNVNNIPKVTNTIEEMIDLTKISLRFPRFKTRREKGKEANTVQDIEKMILLNVSGSNSI